MSSIRLIKDTAFKTADRSGAINGVADLVGVVDATVQYFGSKAKLFFVTH